MKEIFVSQRGKIYIDYYPYAERINPKLHNIVLQKANTWDIGATMTSWKCFLEDKDLEVISTWVTNIIHNLTFSYDEMFELKLKDFWGQYYNKGDYQVKHHHNPHHWSFVYFVNTPRGSSPLVFSESGRQVKAEAGKLVLFPSWLEHHVPKNNSEERSIVAGNFVYILDWVQEKRSVK